MRCEKCKRENHADAKFCEHCGAAISVQNTDKQGDPVNIGASQTDAGKDAEATKRLPAAAILGWYRLAEFGLIAVVILLLLGGFSLIADQVRDRREAASLWTEALSHSRLERYDLALRCATSIIERYPSTEQADYARTSKAAWEKQYAEQQRQIRLAAEEQAKQKKIAEILTGAESLRSQGKIDEAIAEIEKALGLDANHSRARGLQVELQVLAEQKRVRIENERRFTELCRSGADYAAGQQYEKAIDSYTRALVILPNDKRAEEPLLQCRHDLYFTKAVNAEKNGDYEAAIKHYETALTHKSLSSTQAALAAAKKNLEAWIEAGNRKEFERLIAAARTADPNKAVEPLSQALKLYPADTEAVNLKNNVLRQLLAFAKASINAGNTSRASRAIEGVLTLEPSNAQALELRRKMAASSQSLAKSANPDRTNVTAVNPSSDERNKSYSSSPVSPFLGVWGEKWASISKSGNITIREIDGLPKVTMQSNWRVWDEKIVNGVLSFRIKGGDSNWEFVYTVTPVYDIMKLDVYRVHDGARFSGQLTQ